MVDGAAAAPRAHEPHVRERGEQAALHLGGRGDTTPRSARISAQRRRDLRLSHLDKGSGKLPNFISVRIFSDQDKPFIIRVINIYKKLGYHRHHQI